MPQVVATAGRLVLRHWPALLALSLAGAGLRSGVVWAAVEVSDWVGWAGQLILVLAPLGYLVPIVWMLHLCRGSLPQLRQIESVERPEAVTERRERRLVDVAVSVLVPFLAVYVSYGLLQDDLDRFQNEASFDEFSQGIVSGLMGEGVDIDPAGRIGVYPVQVAVMIVLVAFVARWLLGRVERSLRFLAIAFAGALVEVYYTGQVARQVNLVRAEGTAWLEDRVVVSEVQGRYDAVVSDLGPLASPVDTATTWLFGLLGAIDAVVVVPVAWLAVGAVVLGHRLTPAPSPTHPLLDTMTAIPEPVRRAAAGLLDDIRERWSTFWSSLRVLATGGLLPMLVFGVVFLLVIRVPVLLSEGIRLLVGPTDFWTWWAFSPFERNLGMALSMALTAPLLAAALDRLVAPQLSEAARARRTPEAPFPSTAAES